MELIATARFKKAMDRASAATAYTETHHGARGRSGHQRAGSQPSVAGTARARSRTASLLVLTGNRGLCGGYNGNVLRSRSWSAGKSCKPRAARRT